MANAYRKRDVNRFSKTYMYVRQAPQFEYQLPDTLVDRPVADSRTMESGVLSFEGGDTVYFPFQKTYSSVPIVMVSPSDESMKVHVESIDLTQATIKASTENFAFAHVHVLTSDFGDEIDTSIDSIARKVDVTRQTKLYTYVRRATSLSYRLNIDDATSVHIDAGDPERATVSFSGTNTATYNFTRTYGNAPVVILSTQESVNVYIKLVSTTQVVVESSAEGDFSVFIHVVSVD